jgi:hypothetical protein
MLNKTGREEFVGHIPTPGNLMMNQVKRIRNGPDTGIMDSSRLNPSAQKPKHLPRNLSTSRPRKCGMIGFTTTKRLHSADLAPEDLAEASAKKSNFIAWYGPILIINSHPTAPR